MNFKVEYRQVGENRTIITNITGCSRRDVEELAKDFKNGLEGNWDLVSIKKWI